MIRSKEPLTNSEKRLVYGTTILTAVLLGVGLWIDKANQQPDWDLPPLPDLPNPNGYDVYVQAATILVRSPKPAVDELLEIESNLTPSQEAARYSLARRKQWLTANAGTSLTLTQARKLKSQVPLPPYGKPSFNRLGSALRELGRYQVVEANTQIMTGQYDQAVTTALNVFEMASATSRGGALMDGLISSSIEGMAFRPIDTALPHLTAKEASRQADRLTTLLNDRPTMEQIYAVNKWQSLGNLKWFMGSPDWKRNPVYSSGETSLMDMLLVQFRSNADLKAEAVRWLDYSVARAGEPYLSAKPSPPAAATSTFIRPFLPSSSSSRMYYATRMARLRLLLIRLRLHTFNASKHHYPASLSELKDLSAPHSIDPYTLPLSPFKYRRLKQVYQLWSLGPDGKNNDATSIQPIRKGFPNVSEASKGDIVISIPPIPNTPI